MPFKRLIPVLLLNNEELIHRKKYESSSDKYVGDPINTINVFNQYEVDELTILDISTRKNNNDHDQNKEQYLIETINKRNTAKCLQAFQQHFQKSTPAKDSTPSC